MAVGTTASVLFFCSLVGYVLAKLEFPFKNVIFILILSTLMVPTEMLVIPWFVMSADFGWVNTYWGLMFPGLIPGFGGGQGALRPHLGRDRIGAAGGRFYQAQGQGHYHASGGQRGR